MVCGTGSGKIEGGGVAGGVDKILLVGDIDRGERWQSVQPIKKRVTASRGRNAYVSVIWG